VLDPEAGARRPIRVECEGELTGIARGRTGAASWFPTDEPVFVPAGEAAFVHVSGSQAPSRSGDRTQWLCSLGRLDLEAGVLRTIVPIGDGMSTSVLHADSSRILVLEARWSLSQAQAYPDHSIVLYDSVRGTREVVFEASRLE
jgi:hypothetical protein